MAQNKIRPVMTRRIDPPFGGEFSADANHIWFVRQITALCANARKLGLGPGNIVHLSLTRQGLDDLLQALATENWDRDPPPPARPEDHLRPATLDWLKTRGIDIAIPHLVSAETLFGPPFPAKCAQDVLRWVRWSVTSLAESPTSRPIGPNELPTFDDRGLLAAYLDRLIGPTPSCLKLCEALVLSHRRLELAGVSRETIDWLDHQARQAGWRGKRR